MSVDPDKRIDMNCPVCKKDFHQTLGWLVKQSEIACPYCGSAYEVRISDSEALTAEAVSSAKSSFFTKIAGVTHQNSDGRSRQRIVALCRVGEQLVLEREPDCPADPNAIKVLRATGEQLGYIPAHVAASGLARDLDRGERPKGRIVSLTGGEGSTRGVNIEIGEWPEDSPTSMAAIPNESAIDRGNGRLAEIPKDNMQTRFSEVRVTHSARGNPTYTVEAFHDGLRKHQSLRGTDPDVLLNKAKALEQQWNAAWRKQEAASNRVTHAIRQKDQALEQTVEAEHLIELLRNTLVGGIELDPTIDWEELKAKAPFSKKAPAKPVHPIAPAPPVMTPQPDGSDFRYRPPLSVLDHLVPSRKAAKRAAYASRFEADLGDWRKACAELSARHQTALEANREECAKLDRDHAAATLSHEEEKRQYAEESTQHNQQIDQLRKRYQAKDTDAIVEYCDRVLSRSEYPSFIPRECDLELNPETGMLLLNSRLPAPDDLPRLIEVKYIQTSDTFKEVFLSEAQSAKLYDDVVYQITLRTLHELFQSDVAKAISTIVFNGFVTSTDKSTGNEATACILSVQASRDSFLAINLAKVDPKACFRQLKGVGSSKLHSVTPVAPIVELNRNDRRFVASHDVADRLNAGYNLATMDWEDFEHLIREIFQKEFSSSGGEVKVTQASRDGGVDAVAFDPDPIRGGKIVIQAKRYAHTVGVSAVRDLYGTLMNEGASKGILVTTSDYGPDAYEFANGKPLALLSGSNLLHLLAKHGIGAHIDLAEAGKVAQERASQARA